MENSVGMPPIGEAKKRTQKFCNFEAASLPFRRAASRNSCNIFYPRSIYFEMSGGSMGYYRSGRAVSKKNEKAQVKRPGLYLILS